MLSYIEIGKSEHARLVTGGERLTDPDLAAGNFVSPALFADVDPAGLATEEIFGPVLAAIPFDSYDEAVAIANRVEYGLTASVFTRDLRTAMAFSRDVEAGYVWVNETSRHFSGRPSAASRTAASGGRRTLRRSSPTPSSRASTSGSDNGRRRGHAQVAPTGVRAVPQRWWAARCAPRAS